MLRFQARYRSADWTLDSLARRPNGMLRIRDLQANGAFRAKSEPRTSLACCKPRVRVANPMRIDRSVSVCRASEITFSASASPFSLLRATDAARNRASPHAAQSYCSCAGVSLGVLCSSTARATCVLKNLRPTSNPARGAIQGRPRTSTDFHRHPASG